MATSMPSYGIIDADSRCLFIVNALPGEHLDKLIVVNLPPTQAATIQDEDDMWCLLIDDDGPAYLTLWMEFTMNHGSIASARFVDGSQVFDDQQPIEIARFIIQYESKSLHAGGLSEGKISKLPVEIRAKSEEQEEEEEEEEGEGEICVICREEYEAGQTIGTIECGHVYHAECIKKWVVQKNSCPVCRSTAVKPLYEKLSC